METIQPETIQVTCANPQCRRQMKMRNPEKPGVYRLNCPFCKQNFSIRLIDKPESPAETIVTPTREPDNTNQAAAAPEKPASITVTCPSCSTRLSIGNPRPGTHRVKCPKCQGLVDYNGPDINPASKQTQEQKNPTKPISFNAKPEAGCIVIGKSLFSKGKARKLTGRSTIIGRLDPSAPSDIMIDDPTISRRSISINAEVNADQPSYTLTVVNATNPVSLNGNTLAQGAKAHLAFGDTIVLGRTKLIFAKANDYNI